jgi:hypothetical protein
LEAAAPFVVAQWHRPNNQGRQYPLSLRSLAWERAVPGSRIHRAQTDGASDGRRRRFVVGPA